MTPKGRTGPDRAMIFGIINVTPDSFTDGGNFFSIEAAVAHAGRLVLEGANILDVGGESTRPGAQAVEGAEELRRVIPVIRAVRARWPHIPVSIDTVKSTTAEAALREGATIVNDVSAMRLDLAMAPLCAEAKCKVILMHSRGGVAEMARYENAVYGSDAVGEVIAELRERVDAAEDAGVNPDRIAVDPGIGFSKRSEHSLALLAELPRLVALGYPVLVGVSRKRVVAEMVEKSVLAAGAADGSVSNEDRDSATVGVNVAAYLAGAQMFRVHAVKGNRIALDAAWTVMSGTTRSH